MQISHYSSENYAKAGITSIFGKQSYLKSKSEHYGAITSDNIKISFTIKNLLTIKLLTISSFEINNSINETTFNEQMYAIIEALQKSEKIDFITCPATHVIFPYPLKFGNNAKFGTALVNLSLSEEELFKKLHGKHRNVIRKAQKDGLEVLSGQEHKESCYKIIAQTLRRENVYFEDLQTYNAFCDSWENNVQYYIVKKNNEIHGAAVIPFDSKSGYYLWGGSVERPSTGAMNYMHWFIIKDLKSKNVKYYDFVGIRSNPLPESKLYGIKRFKIRFGGEETYGFLFKHVLNRRKYQFFKILYFLKTRTKHSDIIDSINTN